MNDQDMAENEGGEQTAADTTPVAEEQITEDVETTAPEAEQVETETVEGKKKGYEARVRELNAKAKDAEARAQSLAEKLAELTRGDTTEGKQDFNPAPTYNPQEPIIAPGEEIDVNELNKRQSEREARLLQQADSMAQLRAKQSEAIIRINNEANDALRKYPELDPDSDTYNKVLSKSITAAVEAHVRAQPYDASVKKFVDTLMEPYIGAVNKEVGEATEKIARQVSESALKPTAIRKEEKTAQEKSIEELEKELGVVQA